MRTVVGARFMKAGRMYFFDPGAVTDYRVNDWIIVRTELGIDAARLQILPTDSPMVQIDPPIGTVVRKASVVDVLEINKRERMDADAALTAADMVRSTGLAIKVLGADWQFDGSAITIFYSVDPSGRGPAEGERARIKDMPALVEGVGGLMSDRFAAFRKHDIAPAEYAYLEHLVYVTWLGGLATGGDDPAARERAAREIDQAAARESAGAVRARLQQVAAAVRNRVPAAPEGIPEEVHRLLLRRVTEIEAQPAGHVAARLPRTREDPAAPSPTTSP